MSEGPTMAQEIDRYVRTGDSDPHVSVRQRGFLERAKNGLLAEAVERKLPERYPEGKLWLLAYSNDHSVVEEESTNRACAALSGREHPFEAVRVFCLLAGYNGGESVRVNPR